MELGLKGKVALVTGAGRGTGRECALQLAQEGVRVVGVSRSREPLNLLLEEIAQPDLQHEIFPLDLMDPDAVDQLREFIRSKRCEPDIIVHNAGGSLRVTDPQAPSSAWERVWRFNLGVGIDINRAFLERMIRQKWGRIVHFSSRAADTCAGYPAYVSAKAALNAYVKGFGRALAKENVIVSALAPGPIEVEGRYLSMLKTNDPEKLEEYYDHHLAIRRLATAAEIASAAVFLCSEKASYAAGSIFPIDGGNT